MLAFIKTPKNLILKFDGFTKTVPVGPKYDEVLKLIAVKASDNTILNALDTSKRINAHESGMFGVNPETGTVYIKDVALPKTLGDRVIDFSDSGLDFAPLVKFWENCLLNPDKRAQTDLYAFLEHNGHPITSDGCFIAYRYVIDAGGGKYVDCYTGKMDNSIGREVTMDRAKCDPDPNQTCSRGLHCAAFDYVKNQAPIVEVKVNPKDVVAIPTDYNGQKMRVCRFIVMCLNKDGAISGPAYDTHNMAPLKTAVDVSDDSFLDFGKDENEWEEDGALSFETEDPVAKRQIIDFRTKNVGRNAHDLGISGFGD